MKYLNAILAATVLMVQLLWSQQLLAQPAAGRTFYVSQSGGSDTNSGLAPHEAWRTLRRATSVGLLPGDEVLLERGNVWHETLTLVDSGDSSARIRIASYGTGAAPKLFGSATRAGIAQWQSAGEDLWYCESTSSKPAAVILNGTVLREAASLGELTGLSRWYHEGSSGRVYVKLRDNPGNFPVEVVERSGIVISGASNVEIRDLAVEYATDGVVVTGAHGILVEKVQIGHTAYSGIQALGASSNISIVNCALKDWNLAESRGDGHGIMVRGTKQTPGLNWIMEKNSFLLSEAVRGGETSAVQFGEYSHALLIGNNRIQNNSAVLMDGVVIARPQGTQSMSIRGNEIENCTGSGIRIEDLSANAFSAGLTIERNRVLNSAAAVGGNGAGINLHTSGAFPVSLRYNVIAGTAKGDADHPALNIRASQSVTVFHNVFQGADCGMSLTEGSEAVALNNIASGNRKCAFSRSEDSLLAESHNDLDGMVVGIEMDSTSFSADPMFADAGKRDFQLQAGSPCLDRGIAIAGIEQDSFGLAPDVGAAESRGGLARTLELSNDSLTSASTKVAAATVNAATTQSSYLSDLTWVSMINAWGAAEKDRSNGEQGSADGKTLTLNGTTYAKGLGVHAASTIKYNLKGTCTAFSAAVGVDDEVGSNGSVVFQVWADGTKLYDSGTMTGATATKAVNVDVTGRSELSLVVTDAGDGNAYDHADWANAQIACTVASATTPSATTATQLGDLTWTSMTNGWGPAEKNMSNGEQAAGDGKTITLNATTYAKGLGVHAPSTITYNLGGTCTAFNASVGMDDEAGSNGSVVFQVWADGTKLYDSGTMTGATATKTVTADITGRSTLSLVVTDAGDGNAWDHADWANATITCGATSTPVSTIPTSGLGVWFKADAGVTSQSGLVSQWADQSGNARHATQTSSGSQPTAVSNVVSGKPVLRYDGTSDYMSFTLPINGLTAMTLILVSAAGADVDGTYYGDQYAPLFWRETGSWGTVHLSPFQRYVRHRFGTGQSNNIPSYSRTSPATGFSVTTAVKSGTAEAIYVNGIQAANLSGKLATIANTGSAATLGRGTSTYFKGDIAEVIVYTRALTDAERQQVDQYLLAKYGLTSTPAAPATPVNAAPAANAGSDQSITLPASASLTGSVSDDGLPSNTLTSTWTMVSGPGTVTFGSASSAQTTASFSTAGTYVLRLTTSDGALSGSDDVTINVAAAPVVTQPVSNQVVIPADSGYINVKTAYGAKGDGVTDDTAAILRAIRENIEERDHVIYFPDGTYLVSDTLIWKNSSGEWRAYLAFQGQSQSGTIIKLKNNAAGYSDPANPKAVIYTASNQTTSNVSNGQGDEAYRNNIQNLTVDTGTGNPGAIGIDYLANNQGRIDSVEVRSGDGQGRIGLAMTRPYMGPGLIKNVTVSGFDYGISVKITHSSATLENITLKNQRVAGLYNEDNIVSIRKLTSTNTVPAIINTGFPALLTMIDSSLTGGAVSAIAIQNTSDAKMYLRNVTTSGYQSAIYNNGSTVANGTVSEWVSHGVKSLFTSPQKSLGLPIQDTPEFVDTNLNNWANVISYGAKANDLGDDTAAIQAAIDSGKSTVYFPFGKYRISDTIRVRGAVQRIVGMGAYISPAGTSFPAGKPAFRFESGTVSTVIFENISLNRNYDVTGFPEFSFPMIEDTRGTTVVLKNLIDVSYRGVSGAGPLFVENICCGPFEFNSQTVWARQLNSETTDTHLLNNGGKLWVLGYKTEQISTIAETKGGGQTEILGSFFSAHKLESTTALINNESSMSIVYATNSDGDFQTQVSETRDGVTRALSRDSVLRRGYGSVVPLYVGYK